MTAKQQQRSVPGAIEWPVHVVVDKGRSSGGSQVLMGNLRFAASLLPQRFTLGTQNGGTRLIARNTVPLEHLRQGRFVYMPQNAWPWHGPAAGARETGHRLALRVLSELALRRATATVRISEAIPERGALGLPILHNVLDPGFEDALEVSAGRASDTKGSIVSVGSFVPYRNYPRLLEAHRRYRERGGRLRLVLAGPASFPRTLARIERLARGRDDVEVRPGLLQRAKVLAMLRDCEVAILPSLVEASPVSVLEALVLCPRIILSDIPGHRGIARGMLDAATFFDPRSVEDASEKLLWAERSEPFAHSLPISTPAGRAERRQAWALVLEDLVVQFNRRAESGARLRRSPVVTALPRSSDVPQPAEVDRFPRVCIVSSNPLSSRTSNGLMMSSLFGGWPKERLFQVYFPVVVPYLPEFEVCSDFRLVRALGHVVHIPGNGAKSPDEDALKRLETTGRHHLLQHLRKRAGLHSWLKLAQELWYAHSWLGRVLRRQLREIQPDVVYALLGNYCLTKLTCQACAELDLPVYVHVTDDYVTSLYEDKPFSGQLQASSDRWFRRILESATGRAGISPLMAETYGERYGGEWRWFATLVDPEAYDPSPRTEDGELRFVYTGNLGLGRWQSLRRLALALRDLQRSRTQRVRLIIHSFPEQLAAFRDELQVPPIIELAGFVPFQELPRIYHDADVLVHAESFESSYTDYTALSFSNKVVQYLMAGRCILAVSPRRLATARVVEEAGGGLVLDETEPAAIAGAVEKLVRNRDLRLQLARQGRRWAIDNLALGPAQARFRDSLRQAVRDHQRRRAGLGDGS